MRKKKKEKCNSYLSQVAVLLVGVMRHRRRIGRSFMRENQPGREKREREKEKEREREEHSWEARKRNREKEEHIQSTQYHLEIFGGL